MQIEVNGQTCKLAAGFTLEQLIGEMFLTDFQLAIELNLGAIPHQQYACQQLHEGDQLHIIHLK